MTNNSSSHGDAQDPGIDVVKLPDDMQEQVARLCVGKTEIPIRCYVFEIVPKDRVLKFIRLLTYDEHIAACFLIEGDYHRQEAAALVYMGECGAHEGDEQALIPKIVAGREVIRIIGSITLDGVEWTVWRRNEAPRPRDPLLAFSVVRYDARTDTPRPW